MEKKLKEVEEEKVYNLLILGSNGMAGHVITDHFEKKSDEYQVDNISHSRKLNDKSYQFDLTDIAVFDDFLKRKKYDFIINCVGVLNHNAEQNKEKAILLNSYLPRFLEKRFKDSATKIIHLSTDCVFSGEKGGYEEKSFRDGDSFYDRTKILGELDNEKDLTIRTSIIGPDINKNGIGLFNWFMQSKGIVNGYTGAYWSGITTIELAQAIEEIINSQNISGLYHLVAREKINKYDLLSLIKEIFKREDINIKPNNDVLIDKSLVNTRVDFEYTVKSYPAMIEEMREWIHNHKDCYDHY